MDDGPEGPTLVKLGNPTNAAVEVVHIERMHLKEHGPAQLMVPATCE